MTSTGRSLSENLSIMANAMIREEEEEEVSVALRCRIIAETVPLVTSAINERVEAICETTTPKDDTDKEKEGSHNHQEEKEEDTFKIAGTKRKVDDESDRLKQLREQQTQLNEEMERIQKKRRDLFSKQRELWGVYKYGLGKISELNDLHDAPDAILPGNL